MAEHHVTITPRPTGKINPYYLWLKKVGEHKFFRLYGERYNQHNKAHEANITALYHQLTQAERDELKRECEARNSLPEVQRHKEEMRRNYRQNVQNRPGEVLERKQFCRTIADLDNMKRPLPLPVVCHEFLSSSALTLKRKEDVEILRRRLLFRKTKISELRRKSMHIISANSYAWNREQNRCYPAEVTIISFTLEQLLGSSGTVDGAHHYLHRFHNESLTGERQLSEAVYDQLLRCENETGINERTIFECRCDNGDVREDQRYEENPDCLHVSFTGALNNLSVELEENEMDYNWLVRVEEYNDVMGALSMILKENFEKFRKHAVLPAEDLVTAVFEYRNNANQPNVSNMLQLEIKPIGDERRCYVHRKMDAQFKCTSLSAFETLTAFKELCVQTGAFEPTNTEANDNNIGRPSTSGGQSTRPPPTRQSDPSSRTIHDDRERIDNRRVDEQRRNDRQMARNASDISRPMSELSMSDGRSSRVGEQRPTAPSPSHSNRTSNPTNNTEKPDMSEYYISHWELIRFPPGYFKEKEKVRFPFKRNLREMDELLEKFGGC